MVGPCCFARASSSCREQRPVFTVVCGLLITVASLVADHRPGCAQASVVAVRGLSSCGLRALECCGAQA